MLLNPAVGTRHPRRQPSCCAQPDWAPLLKGSARPGLASKTKFDFPLQQCRLWIALQTQVRRSATSDLCHKQTFNPETSTLSPIHSLIGFARSNTAALLACCGVEMMQLHTSM